MTSEIESQISRVINKLENVQPNPNFPPITNETQEGNYRMQKKIAGILTQVNVNNISSFDGQNECNPQTENSNDISNSFSEHPSEIMDQSFPKPSMKRRPSIILDLHKIINIGEYKIELGKLLNILDKKLPENKENIPNNDASKTYTQCTTEENDGRKSFISPEKKIITISEKYSDKNSKNKSIHEENNKNFDDDGDDELIKDKKFDDNLAKKYHKISLLLKGYLNENKLFNELNNNIQNENTNIINNNNLYMNINLNDTMNKYRHRKSLFDMSSYLIPSERSIQSFGKKNTLPNFISNFFDHKKEGTKRKKRNSYVGGQFHNKLKKLNQQMNTKSTSKKIPQSEKAEFKIKSTKRNSMTGDSNIKTNDKNMNMNMNMSSRKSISQISNFDVSNNADCDSIICNDNSVCYGNDNKRTSIVFNDGLSAVKQRRQSDFFENIPQQQDEITGFNKMISTIVEEEDNNNNFNNNNDLPNNNDNVNKEDKNNTNCDIEDEKSEKENNEEKNEDSEESFDEEGDEDEDDDDTISNDHSCYGNISTSLCFDDLNIN